MKQTAILAAFISVLVCGLILSMPQQQNITDFSVIERAPSSLDNFEGMKVNFEFVVNKHEAELYPLTWLAFRDAVKEWAKHIPIRCIMSTRDATKINQDDYALAVPVILTDLQTRPFNYDTGIVGIWDSRRVRILLDAERIEANPITAYNVALHELGHMFGVPHFIGSHEKGYTSFVVLPPGENAENYVMYPRIVQNKTKQRLSTAEIAIARHTVLYVWTNPANFNVTASCETCNHE